MNSINVNSTNSLYSRSYKNYRTQNGLESKSLENKINKTVQSSNTSNSQDSNMSGKDVVMNFPPNSYSSYNVKGNKSKEDMTIDEYKQYICNEISKLPVSASARANFSGSLIIKEEAFEHMKEDSEYEKTVMDMLREGFNVQMPFNAPTSCVQVIGGTMEETYGYGVPLQSSTSSSSSFTSEKESYWKERHAKIEKLQKEQEEKNLKKKEEQKKIDKEKMIEYLNQAGRRNRAIK